MAQRLLPATTSPCGMAPGHQQGLILTGLPGPKILWSHRASGTIKRKGEAHREREMLPDKQEDILSNYSAELLTVCLHWEGRVFRWETEESEPRRVVKVPGRAWA